MARKFDKILVPLDGSDNSMRGLDCAIGMAKASGAEITAFYVFHLPVVAGIRFTKEMKEKAQKKAAKAIGPAMQMAEQAGAKFQYHTAGGHVGEEIVEYAGKNNYDVIVIGGRGLTGAKERFLGSVSNYVMHQSEVPVMIVK